MTKCLCVNGHTRKIAQQQLGYRPLHIQKQVRELVFFWYAVDSIDELCLHYEDAAYALTKLWEVLNYPVNVRMAELEEIPNPTCDFCLGSGEIQWEEIANGI